jgi:small subunit ribosomal protein S18
MAAPRSRSRDPKQPAGVAGARRRSCYFCSHEIEDVDWKDQDLLRRFMSDKGRIRPGRATGSCRRHQVQVSVAVKRAREMALLPIAGR